MNMPYGKYKDSGFEWIKEIPITWDTASMNHVVEFIMGQAPHSDSYNTDGEGEIFIKTGDFGALRPNIKWYTTNPLVFASEEDVFICVVGATSGKVNLGVNGTISRSIAALRPSKRLSQKYFYYFLSYNYQRLNDAAQGSAQGIINKTILAGIKVPLPPKEEQTKIAQYLDHQTALIDQLILQKEKLIELLKEKRQAVINEAVTKGLNPNVKMKDSGIEWLGEVPEDWKVLKLTWITDFITCGIASTPEYVSEEVGVPFLSAQNVKPDRIVLNKFKYISQELHAQLTKIRKPKKGDLLVTRVGAGIGEAAIVDVDFEFSVYVSLTHIRTNEKCINRYLMYFFSSDYAKKLASDGTIEGGGQGNLNVKNVEGYRIGVPPLSEQEEILNYIDDRCKAINDLIEKNDYALSKLKEYRQSIISEAVTGKIDVRDWQPDKNQVA